MRTPTIGGRARGYQVNTSGPIARSRPPLSASGYNADGVRNGKPPALSGAQMLGPMPPARRLSFVIFRYQRIPRHVPVLAEVGR